MQMKYNIYCDESCHLKNDSSPVMILGAVSCPVEQKREIFDDIRAIKIKYGLSSRFEIKWSKVSMSKIDFYMELLTYFWNNKNLNYRGLVATGKQDLNHEKYNDGDIDLWYYKMYFDMLKVIFSPTDNYDVYIDIKDTNSARKAKKLREVCCNSMYDFSQKVIRRLQPIRSDEVQIMQIVDVIIGAIGYENRRFPDGFVKSSAKQEVIDLIKERSGYTLRKTTLLREEKINLLSWEAGGTV